MPVTDARISSILANIIRLDRNLNHVHDLSDSELNELNRNLLTHLARWISGKERDVHVCTVSVSAFCSSHSVPQLESAWYLHLVRESISDFLSRQEISDAEEVRASANRFFDRLVCDILRG